MTTTDARERITQAIKAVTDTWDEPLDDVHDIPPIVNAVMAEWNTGPAVTTDRTTFIDVVFDGPPSHKAGRFVEVENEHGRSVNAGEWIDRGNGLWALRIPTSARPDTTTEPTKRCPDCAFPVGVPAAPTLSGGAVLMCVDCKRVNLVTAWTEAGR